MTQLNRRVVQFLYAAGYLTNLLNQCMVRSTSRPLVYHIALRGIISAVK